MSEIIFKITGFGVLQGLLFILSLFLPAAKRQVIFWCRSKKRKRKKKEVTYGFLTIAASMFGDF